MTTPKRSHPVVVIVTNPQSEQPLSLRMVATTPFRRGEPATIRVIAEGGTGGYVYAVGKGDFPPGMGVLDAITGISTGTPTTAGHYEFVVEVQDSSATVWSERFTVDIVSRLTAGQVSPVPGELDMPYSYQLTVLGATGTVTWKRISGTLPAGLTLADNGPGMLSGTPATPYGRSYATIRATDAGSGDTLDVPIVVNVVRRLGFVGPTGFRPEFRFIDGVESWIDVSKYWRYGLGPFRIQPITPAIDELQSIGLRFVVKGDGRVLFGGVPILPASGPPEQLWDSIFVVRDVLNANAEVPYLLYISSSRGTIGGEMNGVSAAQRSAPTINFIGTSVVAVTASDTKTTVQIDGVRSVSATSPIVSSGGSFPSITHANSGAVAGTYDRVTINLSGHVTAGGYNFSTIFTKNVTAAVQFFAADFASMTTTTDVIRWTGTSAVACSVREFFASPRAGQTVMFVNASAATLTLTNQYVGGTNAAHFDIGADFAIGPGHNAMLWYDGGSQRWRIIGSY